MMKSSLLSAATVLCGSLIMNMNGVISDVPSGCNYMIYDDNAYALDICGITTFESCTDDSERSYTYSCAENEDGSNDASQIVETWYNGAECDGSMLFSTTADVGSASGITQVSCGYSTYDCAWLATLTYYDDDSTGCNDDDSIGYIAAPLVSGYCYYTGNSTSYEFYYIVDCDSSSVTLYNDDECTQTSSVTAVSTFNTQYSCVDNAQSWNINCDVTEANPDTTTSTPSGDDDDDDDNDDDDDSSAYGLLSKQLPIVIVAVMLVFTFLN